MCYSKPSTLKFAVSTITIRLPKDLKARITVAAERAGTTTHDFILEAIAEKADQEERRGEVNDVAEKRYARIVTSGKAIPRHEMRSCPEDRLAGKAPGCTEAGSLRMSRIELAHEVVDDLDGIFDHLARYDVDNVPSRIREIIQGIAVLEQDPLIGRPVTHDKIELVIGRRSRGYVALYCYVGKIETVFVLALRSRREAGYTRT